MTKIETANHVANFPAELQQWLSGRPVEEVECVVSDVVGIGRGKAMPARKFFRSERMFLPSSIFYQTITGDYAEVEIENVWTESDIILKPDLATACAVPWAEDVTVQVICDLENQDGKPFAMAPRNVLKRILALYQKEGWKPVIAPEMEFYLTERNLDPDNPIAPPLGRTGRKSVGRQAYSISGVDEYGKVVDDIYDFAEAMGMEIDTVMQEGGAGQLEINLEHGDPLELADHVFLFKRCIREAALRNDCYATFMAKPMEGQPGSAMHIHQSVVDAKTGKSLFSDEKGEATDLFYGFLGGQQNYLESVVCILAPYVNSYRRLIPDASAPTNLEWGRDNRTTGLRIPVSDPQARRVENRVVGMDSNPYLAIAACLACGYLGMKNKAKPRAEVKGEAYELPHSLPRDVLTALRLFDEDQQIQQVLGEDFSKIYMAIKQHEHEEFLQVISPWEREHLLLNV